jgi:hypothetical protein
MKYLLVVQVPYEMGYSDEFETIDGVKKWLKKNKSSYEDNLNFVEVYKISKTFSWDELKELVK